MFPGLVRLDPSGTRVRGLGGGVCSQFSELREVFVPDVLEQVGMGVSGGLGWFVWTYLGRG